MKKIETNKHAENITGLYSNGNFSNVFSSFREMIEVANNNPAMVYEYAKKFVTACNLNPNLNTTNHFFRNYNEYYSEGSFRANPDNNKHSARVFKAICYGIQERVDFINNYYSSIDLDEPFEDFEIDLPAPRNETQKYNTFIILASYINDISKYFCLINKNENTIYPFNTYDDIENAYFNYENYKKSGDLHDYDNASNGHFGYKLRELSALGKQEYVHPDTDEIIYAPEFRKSLEPLIRYLYLLQLFMIKTIKVEFRYSETGPTEHYHDANAGDALDEFQTNYISMQFASPEIEYEEYRYNGYYLLHSIYGESHGTYDSDEDDEETSISSGDAMYNTLLNVKYAKGMASYYIDASHKIFNEIIHINSNEYANLDYYKYGDEIILPGFSNKQFYQEAFKYLNYLYFPDDATNFSVKHSNFNLYNI